MTQNLNLSLLGKYANSAGNIASSGISGALPAINGGTFNSSLNVTAGGIVYGGTALQMLTTGGGGTSGSALTYNGTIPVWGSAAPSGMLLLKTTFMSGSSQTITPSGASMSTYKTIYLFFNNVTGGGTGNLSLGSSIMYPSQSGSSANGLYGGFMISNTSGYCSGSIGRNYANEYFFAPTTTSGIVFGLGLSLNAAGAGLFTGGNVYCYGQK